MEKETLLKTYLDNPTEDNCKKCVEYCCLNDYNPGDKTDEQLFHTAAKYLMVCKIGHIDKEEAKLLIKYFSMNYAASLNLADITRVEILNEEDFIEKYGKTSLATCVRDEISHTLVYSPSIVEKIMSNDLDQFLIGMQKTFHEVVHALQNNIIYSNGVLNNEVPPKLSIYTQTVETVIRRIDSKFYDTNYSKIYKENHAELIGLKTALIYIKNYNSKLYDMYDINYLNELMDKYKEKMKSSLNVFGTEGSHLAIMDPAICIYVKNHPSVLEELPALNLSFNKDCTKKSITQLLLDRKSKLNDYEKRDELDELYEALCVDQNVVVGGQKGTKEQLKELVNYTQTNGLDYFEYKIFEKKLSHKQIPEDLRNTVLDWAKKCIIQEETPPPMGVN